MLFIFSSGFELLSSLLSFQARELPSEFIVDHICWWWRLSFCLYENVLISPSLWRIAFLDTNFGFTAFIFQHFIDATLLPSDLRGFWWENSLVIEDCLPKMSCVSLTSFMSLFDIVWVSLIMVRLDADLWVYSIYSSLSSLDA